MNTDEAQTLVDAFMGMHFDQWLRVNEATVVGLPNAPVLLIRFTDERHPGRELGAWWDFHGMVELIHDPEHLASFAKTYLEELFHAGGALNERPVDSDGVAWGELDWAEDHRLPPHPPA